MRSSAPIMRGSFTSPKPCCMSARLNSSESLPAARAISSMKHSRYTPFWLVLTPRHGPTGTVGLGFQAEFTRFSDLADESRLPDHFE